MALMCQLILEQGEEEEEEEEEEGEGWRAEEAGDVDMPGAFVVH